MELYCSVRSQKKTPGFLHLLYLTFTSHTQYKFYCCEAILSVLFPNHYCVTLFDKWPEPSSWARVARVDGCWVVLYILWESGLVSAFKCDGASRGWTWGADGRFQLLLIQNSIDIWHSTSKKKKKKPSRPVKSNTPKHSRYIITLKTARPLYKRPLNLRYSRGWRFTPTLRRTQKGHHLGCSTRSKWLM